MQRPTRYLPAIAAIVVLAACGGGGETTETGGTGTLNVSMTDAPACGYDNVWVTVTKVRVHQSATAGDNDAGWSEVLVDPVAGGRRIDLLELQNGVLTDLGQAKLPAGHYTQVRLVLADNAVVPGANEIVVSETGQRVALDTPSAMQSGLKLRHPFDVADGGQVDLLLDFDACKSVVKSGDMNQYSLKPVISVIPTTSVSAGRIVGAVDATAAGAGAGVSLQRFDPITGVVTVVRATTARADGSWELSPVPASPPSGSGYNVVIASRGYENVVFTNVPVSTGATTTIPSVALAGSDPRSIEGAITPAGVGSVEALQEVKPGVVVQAAFANANAADGSYSVSVPAGPARVAPYAASSPAYGTGDNPGLYVVRATDGASSLETPVSVAEWSMWVDFAF